MMVKDYTGQYQQKAAELSEFLNRLPEFPKIPPIEIWHSARDVRSSKEIAEIQKDNPDFDPDEADGECYNGVVRLFQRAFDPPFELPLKVKEIRPKGILLHEIGHRVMSILSEQDQFDTEEWNRVRKADGGWQVSKYVGDTVRLYGFSHRRSQSEDFADSFRYFFLIPEEFARKFPNRFAFCQKLLSQKSHPQSPL